MKIKAFNMKSINNNLKINPHYINNKIILITFNHLLEQQTLSNSLYIIIIIHRFKAKINLIIININNITKIKIIIITSNLKIIISRKIKAHHYNKKITIIKRKKIITNHPYKIIWMLINSNTNMLETSRKIVKIMIIKISSINKILLQIKTMFYIKISKCLWLIKI